MMKPKKLWLRHKPLYNPKKLPPLKILKSMGYRSKTGYRSMMLKTVGYRSKILKTMLKTTLKKTVKMMLKKKTIKKRLRSNESLAGVAVVAAGLGGRCVVGEYLDRLACRKHRWIKKIIF